MTFDWAIVATTMIITFATLVLDIRGKIEVRTAYATYAICGFIQFLVKVALGESSGAVFTGTLSAVVAYLWWRNRRKGGWKKAVRQLGAKSRARIEQLVENMTPSPLPSPAK